PDGQPITLPQGESYWWLGHDAGETVPVAFANGAVHIADGTPSSRALADSLATFFDGAEHEG
ncbi:hypothetical protein, partial [Lysobacter sp. Root916]|uniref:hypothetical protein n=1 Tax=Lysobacter sp. Root916 TaxID=1736606 RepID=UPI001F478D49